MKKIIVVLVFLAVFSSLVFAKGCSDYSAYRCPRQADNGDYCCVSWMQDCTKDTNIPRDFPTNCYSVSASAGARAPQCLGHCYYKRPFKCSIKDGKEQQICRVGCNDVYDNVGGVFYKCSDECEGKIRGVECDSTCDHLLTPSTTVPPTTVPTTTIRDCTNAGGVCKYSIYSCRYYCTGKGYETGNCVFGSKECSTCCCICSGTPSTTVPPTTVPSTTVPNGNFLVNILEPTGEKAQFQNVEIKIQIANNYEGSTSLYLGFDIDGPDGKRVVCTKGHTWEGCSDPVWEKVEFGYGTCDKALISSGETKTCSSSFTIPGDAAEGTYIVTAAAWAGIPGQSTKLGEDRATFEVKKGSKTYELAFFELDEDGGKKYCNEWNEDKKVNPEEFPVCKPLVIGLNTEQDLKTLCSDGCRIIIYEDGKKVFDKTTKSWSDDPYACLSSFINFPGDNIKNHDYKLEIYKSDELIASGSLTVTEEEKDCCEDGELCGDNAQCCSGQCSKTSGEKIGICSGSTTTTAPPGPTTTTPPGPTTTVNTSTTTQTPTTTLPPKPKITCDRCVEGQECSCTFKMNKTCSAGLFIAKNHGSSEALKYPVVSSIPPYEIKYTPEKSGEVDIIGICFDPVITVGRTTVNVEEKFINCPANCSVDETCEITAKGCESGLLTAKNTEGAPLEQNIIETISSDPFSYSFTPKEAGKINVVGICFSTDPIKVGKCDIQINTSSTTTTSETTTTT
ncbi:MAG: hypothetical protein J7J92_03505 [Candidatus Aenigmarchaeota archaeon]|nr:hypothetical protein [Candidatus Aenigmarchaeota archaeon]